MKVKPIRPTQENIYEIDGVVYVAYFTFQNRLQRLKPNVYYLTVQIC